MSRIGKKLIAVPSGVTVAVTDAEISVKGPKGELKRKTNPIVSIKVENNTVSCDVKNKEDKKERSLWGTFSSHMQNMIEGVTKGFEKKLEINGVGYKAAMQGKDLKLEVGYSHPVIFKTPEGIKISVEKNVIIINGSDKELVGETTASIRAVKPPEPYKGKGIKYVEETIRRKAGKTAKSAK